MPPTQLASKVPVLTHLDNLKLEHAQPTIPPLYAEPIVALF